MGTIEQRWRHGMTRRKALAGLAGILAGSPLLGAQQDPRPLKDHKRVPGLDEMLLKSEVCLTPATGWLQADFRLET